MAVIRDVIDFVRDLAPLDLAEEWDNVGLLMGDPELPVQAVMTCLTLTDDTVAEAREREANLVISHHPLPFRPLKQITVMTPAGRLVWRLAAGQIAVYSPHTAFDSATLGINQRLARGLGLADPKPIRYLPQVEPPIGSGRWGRLDPAITLGELADRLKRFLDLTSVMMVGDADRSVSTVAVACGAADEFLADAVARSCDVFITGEARFHTCLDAVAHGVAMLLPGHFSSERFAVERLAGELEVAFPDLTVWAAEREFDPLLIR